MANMEEYTKKEVEKILKDLNNAGNSYTLTKEALEKLKYISYEFLSPIDVNNLAEKLSEVRIKALNYGKREEKAIQDVIEEIKEVSLDAGIRLEPVKEYVKEALEKLDKDEFTKEDLINLSELEGYETIDKSDLKALLLKIGNKADIFVNGYNDLEEFIENIKYEEIEGIEEDIEKFEIKMKSIGEPANRADQLYIKDARDNIENLLRGENWEEKEIREVLNLGNIESSKQLQELREKLENSALGLLVKPIINQIWDRYSVLELKLALKGEGWEEEDIEDVLEFRRVEDSKRLQELKERLEKVKCDLYLSAYKEVICNKMDEQYKILRNYEILKQQGLDEKTIQDFFNIDKITDSKKLQRIWEELVNNRYLKAISEDARKQIRDRLEKVTISELLREADIEEKYIQKYIGESDIEDIEKLKQINEILKSKLDPNNRKENKLGKEWYEDIINSAVSKTTKKIEKLEKIDKILKKDEKGIGLELIDIRELFNINYRNLDRDTIEAVIGVVADTVLGSEKYKNIDINLLIKEIEKTKSKSININEITKEVRNTKYQVDAIYKIIDGHKLSKREVEALNVIDYSKISKDMLDKLNEKMPQYINKQFGKDVEMKKKLEDIHQEIKEEIRINTPKKEKNKQVSLTTDNKDERKPTKFGIELSKNRYDSLKIEDEKEQVDTIERETGEYQKVTGRKRVAHNNLDKTKGKDNILHNNRFDALKNLDGENVIEAPEKKKNITKEKRIKKINMENIKKISPQKIDSAISEISNNKEDFSELSKTQTKEVKQEIKNTENGVEQEMPESKGKSWLQWGAGLAGAALGTIAAVGMKVAPNATIMTAAGIAIGVTIHQLKTNGFFRNSKELIVKNRDEVQRNTSMSVINSALGKVRNKGNSLMRSIKNATDKTNKINDDLVEQKEKFKATTINLERKEKPEIKEKQNNQTLRKEIKKDRTY